MARKKPIGTCHICYAHIRTIVSSCGCPICPCCWHQMILTKIQEKNSVPETLTCPREKCLKQLSITTLSQKLPKSAQDEINQATLKVYLSKTSDIRQCPSTKCNYAGIIDTSSSCSESLHCKACGTTWRDQIHYSSFEKIQYKIHQVAKQKNEVFSELWKKMKTKKCPKCKVSIDKNGGCDHMTCSKCNFEFCWACMQGSHHPAHNLSKHNFEAFTKPMIFGWIMFFAFLLMFYCLYRIPPINFVVHATVVPAAKWCWSSIFVPILSTIFAVFGPPISWCWPYVKAVFKWVGDYIFAGILLNLIFHQTWILMMKLTRNPCPTKISKKASFGIVTFCIGLTYHSEMYHQMINIGMLEAFILLCFYLRYRINLMKTPVMRQKRCYV